MAINLSCYNETELELCRAEDKGKSENFDSGTDRNLKTGFKNITLTDFVTGEGLRIFGLCPGYDDTHLTAHGRQGLAFRRMPHRGTRTYEQMQRAARELDPPPQDVVITSFNEFHENTNIEPSRKTRDRFLRSTRAFKERLVR